MICTCTVTGTNFFFGKRERKKEKKIKARIEGRAWVTKKRKKVFIKFGDELLFKRFVLHFSKI